MNRIAPILSLAAAAALAGCGTLGMNNDQSQAAANPPATQASEAQATGLQPGIGSVESVSAAPPSASAGGTSSAPTQYVGLRMQDGSMQYIYTDAQNLQIGDKVQVTADGYLRTVGANANGD